MDTIIIVPIGCAHPIVLAQVCHHLSNTFPVQLEVAPPLSHPTYAYDAARRQYYSTAIISELKNLKHEGKVLGIADVDLFVPALNFVFGEADPVAGLALISLSRLRKEHYGLPPDEELLVERATKEAVHELGHTYGLSHCPNRRCVMHFSNSLADTDVKGPGFCPECAQRLR